MMIHKTLHRVFGQPTNTEVMLKESAITPIVMITRDHKTSEQIDLALKYAGQKPIYLVIKQRQGAQNPKIGLLETYAAKFENFNFVIVDRTPKMDDLLNLFSNAALDRATFLIQESSWSITRLKHHLQRLGVRKNRLILQPI
jgi:hypothetical protein